MSIRKKFSEEHSEVDTGPLNDILFILMFFFLIISTLANPNVVKVTNPKYKTQTKAKQSIIISIKSDGRTYIGQKEVPFDSLYAELSKRIDIKDTTNKQSVVINADTALSYNKVVMAMAAAKQAGAATQSLGVDAK
ncbi:MAG: biopolymer transporter ExbD [Bacteroidetes bacterium]|nr:biopolymer transporter ExbD [Bacteroidota bacterium]